MSLHRTLALLCLVVLAGCLGPAFGPVDVVDGPSSGSNPETTAETGSATNDGESQSGTPVGETESPWGPDPIVVGIEGSSDRDVTPVVQEATAFWEAHARQYAGYPVDYEVRPDAENPDLVLQFHDEIVGCQSQHDTAGCAPYITRAAQIDRPVTVEIKRGLSDASTVQVVAHELGHTLGLGHDDEPQDVMRTGVTLTTLPQPNATERAFPWANGDFTVYIDVSEASNPQEARRQVRETLGYYERGAPGMPDNLTFRVVDDPTAELVVEYVSSSACTDGSGSCGSSRGPDPDGDGASEYYSQFTVSVVGLDTDAIGWHTGYWLAMAFGAESDSDKPPVFQGATYEDRRSEWWRENE